MSGFDLTELYRELEQQKGEIPPLECWNPEFCGDIDMRIAADGTWFYQGSPIGRKAMVKLFSHVLWLEEGRYFLKTPVEKVGIQVDDLPFLFIDVDNLEGDQGQELLFTSSTGDKIIAGSKHPLTVEENATTGEPAPSLEVRFGMRGRISRTVFYRLVDMAATEPCNKGGEELVVYSRGERFSLGRI